MTTIASFDHEYLFDDEFRHQLETAYVSADEVAEFIEHSALGADLVTGISIDGIHQDGLLVEQYALMLPEPELRANIAASLTKFKDWLFKFSPELACF